MSTPFLTQSASGAVNTLTSTGTAGKTQFLTKLVISVGAQPAWVTSPNLQIKDGAAVIFAADLPPSGSAGFIIDVPLPTPPNNAIGGDQGIFASVGNDLSVVVASPGGTIKTIINAKIVFK